ncbi:hypothetical protein SAMN00120144_0727 [Hymenobacter roseosalivarius DSM 11622]|uniref:Uncharacterized protein n=1 Tax=Hymenobacter roseosalivarius DSM 11622 TaxID=645990 RepID=A0A1W1UR72_9BACT|nr:hypothetical protein [Hymenobacter roseosalivarius]SMB83556.1 hypothetical protein SAMN00120144_0727 [Hymenobacter roseosalivarius DSM 11622]
MISRFWKALDEHPIEGIELVVANVLQLQALPASWRNSGLGLAHLQILQAGSVNCPNPA